MKMERASDDYSVVINATTSACRSGVKGYMLCDFMVKWSKTINWPAIGSVSISEAREFADAIHAVCDALEKEPER